MAEEIQNEEFNEEEFIRKVQKFLKRSSDRFNEDIDRQERALEVMGGGYWNDDTKDRWHIINPKTKKDSIPVIAYNNITPQVNSIASPFSRSPFHINIVDHSDQNKIAQVSISKIESSNNCKNVYQRAATRATACSAGYIVIGTELGETNTPVPNVEFCGNQRMVAFDPDCIEPSGEDAEEGAIISYIPVKKARRLYGDDVAPQDYPSSQPILNFVDIKAWSNKTDKIQVVKYFRKENVEDGNERVFMYTICGNHVIGEPIRFETNIIPIVRFAGYNDYDADKGMIYTGYVDKMMSHIEMMSLALTMQGVRMRRCSNIRIVSGKKATQGCESYFNNFESGNSLALIYNDANGATPPVITSDTFQTGDISALMQEERQAMQDCSGVNLQGIQGTERTATEIMQQQINSESNVQELYINWEAAIHTIGKIMLGILCNGVVPQFTIEGGPGVITNQMKERSELQAIQTMVPPEQQMLLAIRMASTIDSDIGKGLVQDLKANCGLQLTEGQDIGGVTNAAQMMKNQLDQAMQQLQELTQQVQDLTQENKSLNLALENQKASQAMQMIEMKHKFEMDQANLALQSEQESRKLDQADTKLEIEATKVINDQSKFNQQILQDAMKSAQPFMPISGGNR